MLAKARQAKIAGDTRLDRKCQVEHMVAPLDDEVRQARRVASSASSNLITPNRLASGSTCP